MHKKMLTGDGYLQLDLFETDGRWRVSEWVPRPDRQGKYNPYGAGEWVHHFESFSYEEARSAFDRLCVDTFDKRAAYERA